MIPMSKLTMNRLPGRIALLLLAATLAGCGREKLSGNCAHQMDVFRDLHGEPQEVERFESGNFHRHTWWYWRLGLARTFTWDGAPGSCEMTDRTFPPSEQRPATAPQPR